MQTFSLHSSVIATIAYFDQFDYPLTALETWNYLVLPNSSEVSFEDLLAILDEFVLNGRLLHREGFYMLPGREDLVFLRKERYLIAEKKWRRALRFARFFSMMPFVKMVGICNGLAFSNARADSDIDFFIVASRGKIWVARFFCTGFAKILGVRPAPDRRASTICLSFFVDEEYLNLSQLALPEMDGLPDVHFFQWVRGVWPVYDDGVYDALWRENTLAGTVFPFHFMHGGHPRRMVVLSWFERLIKRVGELFVGVFGRWGVCVLKDIQMTIMPAVLRDMASQDDTKVVVNDAYLKLHVNDRRQECQQQFVRLLSSLMIDSV